MISAIYSDTVSLLFYSSQRRLMNSLIPSFVGFGGGFFTALFAEPVRRWFYAPKLNLTFGKLPTLPNKNARSQPRWSVRVLMGAREGVENHRAALAKSCRGYLVNIERQATSGKFEATEYCESMQLAWSSPAEQSFSAFDLPRGVPHFVDIIWTRPTSIEFQLAIRATPLRYARLVQTQGVYRFTLWYQATASSPPLFARWSVGLALGTRSQRWIHSIGALITPDSRARILARSRPNLRVLLATVRRG
jgi:hypothetical protein